MTAPHHDDLEQRLAELFQQRASTVTRARPVAFDEGSLRAPKAPAGVKQVRFGAHRQNLGILAAAAVVFIAIAGTILGIQAHQRQPAPPLSTGSHPMTGTPTATPTTTPPKPCVVAMPVSWRQAIAGGTVPVDRAMNTVVSADGAAGDYLVVQGNEPPPQTSAIYSDVELALFHGAMGQTIYRPSSNSDIPVADPNGGAITTDWVTFGVTHPQNLRYTTVLLYDRRNDSTTTLADVTYQDRARGAGFIGSPVIAAGKVYWLASTFNKPATTTLNSWDLARGASAGSVPAPNATELISYGSGMIVSYGTDDRAYYPVETRTAMRNGAGRPLTQAQLAAAAKGTNFGYDGAGTLSWLRHDGNAIGYSSVKVGTAGVRNDAAIRQYAGGSPAVYPFTQAEVNESQSGLLDLRTRTLVAPPAGVSLQAVVGQTVIFGTGTTKGGAAGLSAVPLSALPTVSC